MSEGASVTVEVDGTAVVVPLVLVDVGGLWTAETTMPAAVTPRASVSIRGYGVGRARAIADALEKIRDAVARYATARENVRNS